MGVRKIAETLDEAYRLRDEAEDSGERDFYQEQVFRLRAREYRRRGIRTQVSSLRREQRSAIDSTRELFFLEATEIANRRCPGGEGQLHEEVRRFAGRLDAHAVARQRSSSHSGAAEACRRNYLEFLRVGKPPKEAYYLSRIVGPAGDEEFGRTLVNVRRTGYPRGRLAYGAKRTAIQVRDLSGGAVPILLVFFAPLFAFAWAASGRGDAGAGTMFFVAPSLAVALVPVFAVLGAVLIRAIPR